MNTVRARVWQFQVQEAVVTVTEVGQGELPVGLARLIHINALACDHNRVLDYRTKQLEVRLLASYLHTAGADGPLRVDHRAFTASSRHIRGFVAESSGDPRRGVCWCAGWWLVWGTAGSLRGGFGG